MKTIRIMSLLALVFSGLAQATPAGRVLYTIGDVRAVDGDDELQLKRGDAIVQGHTILTGPGARTQLRMHDGGLISLRPATEFRIREYAYTPSRPTAAFDPRRERGFFDLVKGGLRFISGAIGKDNHQAFEVKTRMAIIGIRGTTFDVACVDGCRERVVAGVTDGRIVIANSAGELVLENDEFGQATAWDRVPTRLPSSPPELRDDMTRADPSDERSTAVRETDEDEELHTDSDYSTSSNSQEQAPPDGRDEVATDATENPLRGAQRDVAYGTAPFGADAQGRALTASSDADQYEVDSRQRLLAFDGAYPSGDETLTAARYSINGETASNLDTGRDPSRGLSWGRWGGGSARVELADGSTQNLDLSQQSLHWILPAARDGNPTLPAVGSRAYRLIGNTDPTDQSGNRGVLGAATLTADFSNQTVDSTLNLFIADEAWAASGSGQLGSGNAAHLFDGAYQNVSTDGTPGGSGAFAGFFTDNAAAAGLNYVLNGANRQISGVAAFAEN